MPRHFRFLLLAALLAPTLGAFAADALTQVSPFLPPAGSSMPESTTRDVLEFAGVSTVQKQTIVSIFNTQEKRGRWIPVGSTAEGIEVISYDANRDQVVVRNGGQVKVLALRQPNRVANSGFAAAPAAPFATPAPTLAPTPTPTPVAPIEKKPLTLAQQEEEARMFVADMLDIGMQSRKAYEEAQKKAAADKAAGVAPATPVPVTTPPATTQTPATGG